MQTCAHYLNLYLPPILSLLGNPLMPDYFLDEAEQFRDSWVSGDSSAASGSSSSVGQIFEKIHPLINPEIVKSISATYKFSVAEEPPGMID